MSADMKCPYCGSGEEVCHDDGAGYAEDVLHEHTCSECEKTFVFTTATIHYYHPAKADCLNGSPRLHDRRGHLRKYKSGKTGWVKACKVGNAALGTVFHDYEVRT